MLVPHPRRRRGGIAIVALAVAIATGCAQATPTRQLRMVPVNAGPTTALSQVRLPPRVDCVIGLRSGDLVRGRLVHVEADAVVLDVPGEAAASRQRIADAEIASIGRVVGRSKPRRAWIGALIGAVVSLPLSISEPGDAVLVGALLGGLIGGRTGDARIEVLLQR